MQRMLGLFAHGIVAIIWMVSGATFAKDGIIEINGLVQARPATLIGDWTIAGRTVRTDAATLFKQELGPLAVGALVEAKGSQAAGGAVLAQVIEVKQPAATSTLPPGQAPSEVTGVIETLPPSGLVGTWKVAGRTVVVVAATQIDQEHGGVAVGAVVEAKGTLNADQSIAASRIEVKRSATAPTATGGDVEIVGAIDTLPAGLLGAWTVAGRVVIVDATTTLDAEHGTFAAGTIVEVHASKRSDGLLAASRIERKAGIGAAVPPARFWGRITALPGASLVGLWKIDGTITVDVLASTEIRINDGPIAIGAIVEVQGWPQTDGVIAAREIETRVGVGQIATQGSVVVEYRNAKLGHFFLTASPAEIAILDAGAFGGAWVRTGESFRTGGTQAVCRFYGMPPRGPDSHFYTASAAECERVMADFPAWTFEDHAFAATPTVAGACPAGLVPVHRFYNNPARADDMNHRFTVTAAAFNEAVALGWLHEGIVMCAQR